MQVRKAEFIFAELKDKGCDCIVTVGGVHSNHARTTAVVAKEIGVEPHLILFHKQKHLVSGNSLLTDMMHISTKTCARCIQFEIGVCRF